MFHVSSRRQLDKFSEESGGLVEEKDAGITLHGSGLFRLERQSGVLLYSSYVCVDSLFIAVLFVC